MQTEQNKHKHAAVFEAAAQGKVDEWEVNAIRWGSYVWDNAINYLNTLYNNPDILTSRRKQKTHIVNGFTVPEPLRDEPAIYEPFFVEQPAGKSFCIEFSWGGFDIAKNSFERGIAHATKEGAIANCKARLGIDPYKE